MPPLLQLPLPLLLQRLGELLVSSTAIFPGGRRQPGVEALRRVLEDPAVFYRVRCDAALALAGLRDEQGQAVGECGRLCRWMRPEIYLQASVRCFGGHGRLLLQVCSAFECVPLPTAPPPDPHHPHPPQAGRSCLTATGAATSSLDRTCPPPSVSPTPRPTSSPRLW